ncbi:hypothetical protein [Thioclava sp. F36-6]|uniref:hypothetical protein n=1 Tax=Thioclava sp. F36-6 TaxID=1915316 RepID=UPI000998B0F3|nr:hypothetical protein [Thioclava sp. F36-6]OOY31583.1 hypothetical protein BMI88_10905 [Thioclava sp. F36-6]
MADVDTGLVLRLEASLAKFEKQMARAQKVGNDVSKGIENQFTRYNKKMSQTAEQSAVAIGKEMDRLRMKYDPLFRASKQYEAAVEELNRAQKVGALTSKQYDAALAELTREYQRSAGAANTMGKTAKSAGMFARGMGGGIQNAAFQVGDFAVQVGAGTSAARALGMQLPQLLGSFGVFGAVAGAAAAIIVPLIASFMSGEEESKKWSDTLQELSTAVGDYNTAVQDSLATTAEMAEKYGALSDAMRKTLDAIVDTTRIKALRELGEAATAAASQIGSLQNRTDAEGNFIGASEAFMALVKQFDLGAVAASRVKTAMDNLASAEGPQQTVDAAQALRSILVDTFGAYEKMPPEIAKQVDAIDAVVLKAGELGGSMETAAASAQGLANVLEDALNTMIALAGAEPSEGWLSGAIAKAQALAGHLWDAAKAQATVTQKAVDAEKKWTKYQYEQYGQGHASAQKLIRDGWKPEKKPGRGGGGSASKAEKPGLFEASDQQLTNLQRQIDLLGKTKSETAALEAKWKLLDEAKKRGIDLDSQVAGSGETVREQIDRQAQSIGDLTAKYEQAQERAQFFEQAQQTLKDGLVDAIVEGKNLSGVLEDLAKMLAKAALQAALFGEGPLGGGGSGLLGGLVSSIFGGGTTPMMPKGGYTLANVNSYDGGGFTGLGARSGGVDGKGGFPAILHPNETILDHTKGQSGGVTVSMSIDARGASGGEAQNLQRVASQIVDRAVAKVKAAQKRGY